MTQEQFDDEHLFDRGHAVINDDGELELDQNELEEVEDDLADDGELDLEPDEERGE